MVANMIRQFVLLLLCMVPLAALGESLPDPTRPPIGFGLEGSVSGMTAYPQVRGLQSVVVSPEHCAAIIDGKTVVLGAKHGSERLVEVNARGVVLQGEHGRRALTLFPAVGMKITETMPQDRPAVKCQLDQVRDTKSPAKQAGQKEKK